MKHRVLNLIARIAILIFISIIIVCMVTELNINTDNKCVDVLPEPATQISALTEDTNNCVQPRYDIPETTQPSIPEVVGISYTNTPYGISYDDTQLLVRLAMSEAGNQDIQGKALVIAVVLNRVQDSQFPDTINDVIMQENQFTPVSDGTFYEVEPDDECYEALNLVMLQGWDESQGALFFEGCSNADNWHSRNLEYLFTHGDHRFYK